MSPREHLRRILARRKHSGRPDRSSSTEPLFDEEFQRRIEYLSIVARRAFVGRTRAERRSTKTGSGIEFADHREYVPGDDVRFIDWHAYGRLGRLLIRLYEEEEDLSVYLLLDVSSSMTFGTPRKIDYGRRIVAALAYISLASLDRVSILTFSESMVSRLPPTRGKARIFRVFEFLEAQDSEGQTELAAAMKTFVAQNKRRGIVVLVSDLYDPSGVEEGINVLRYAKFEPYILHLIDERESVAELYGDLRIVDCETQEVRDVTITPGMLRKYEQARRAMQKHLAEFCAKKQVTYFSLDTAVSFDEAILYMLRRGGMIG